jgi:transcriptional regulator with XRE-family HTH domain
LGWTREAPHDGAAVARNSADYASFLRRLRRARVDAGLSQTAVARQLGKPQSYVSKCESGERRVDVIELLAFARVYGVSVNAFLEDRAYAREMAPERLRRVAEPRKRKG